jgi:hypothetical protein
VRYFLLSVDRAYLVDRTYIRRQPAVNAEDASVDDRADREGIEALDAVTPCRRVAVFPIALVVETVNLRDLPALFRV